MRFIGLAVLILLTFSCGSQKRTVGSYASKFPTMGFFGTRIKLKPDSTFEYRHAGDMIFDTATGIYFVANKKVYLKFLRLKENIFPSEGLLPSYVPRMEVKESVPFEYDYLCFIGNRKLFEADVSTGKKVTKAFGYSRRKKYLLFGSHYFERRYYLKKLD